MTFLKLHVCVENIAGVKIPGVSTCQRIKVGFSSENISRCDVDTVFLMPFVKRIGGVYPINQL